MGVSEKIKLHEAIQTIRQTLFEEEGLYLRVDLRRVVCVSPLLDQFGIRANPRELPWSCTAPRLLVPLSPAMALTPKMAEIKNQDMEEEVAQALIQLCCDTMLKVRDHGSCSQPLPAPPGLIAVFARAGPGREPNGPAD